MLTAAGMAACDNLGLGGEPSEITISIEGTGFGEAVLIRSTDWVFIENTSCEDGQECPPSIRVLAADTSRITPPFEATYAFTSTLRYLVETFPADSVTATMGMEVEIDGRPWYSEERQLRPVGEDGERESLQFTYRFREPTLR